MKITRLEIFHVRPISTQPGESQRPILLKIDTDEGIYGLGEAGLAYGAAGQAAVGILKDFGAKIIGLDPLNIEGIWN